MGGGKKQAAQKLTASKVVLEPSYALLWGLLACYAWMLTWYEGFLFSWLTRDLGTYLNKAGSFLATMADMPMHVVGAAILPVGYAGAIFASALLLGRMILDIAEIHSADDSGRNLWSLGIGLGLLSHGLLLLGVIGLWRTSIMSLLVGLPLAAGAVFYGRNFGARIVAARAWFHFSWPSPWEVAGFGVLASYLMMNYLAAMGPEFFYDSLVYHLALPKLYLLNHRISATPAMIYSGIPFGTEMLYGLSLALYDESLAKLVHFGFGAATAAAVYIWCKKNVNRQVALLATLLFYSAHMIVIQSWFTQVELAWGFYFFLSAWSLLEAALQENVGGQRRLLALAGTLAGFAASTKFNALLYVFVLPLPLIYHQFRSDTKDIRMLAEQIGIFLFTAVLVCSPWFIKNQIFYHNPTFPFLQGWFGGPLVAGVAALRGDAKARDIMDALTTWAGFKDLIAGIWSPRWGMSDTMGAPITLALPWVFLVPRQWPRHRHLLVILLGVWLAWALHTRMPRFFIPAIPLFSILAASAVGLVEMAQWIRTSIRWAFLLVFIVNLGGAFSVWKGYGLWRVAYGWDTRDEFLLHGRRGYEAPYYPGIRFINEKLPEDAVVLFVGESRGYYSERRFITSSIFDVIDTHIINVLFGA